MYASADYAALLQTLFSAGTRAVHVPSTLLILTYSMHVCVQWAILQVYTLGWNCQGDRLATGATPGKLMLLFGFVVAVLHSFAAHAAQSYRCATDVYILLQHATLLIGGVRAILSSLAAGRSTAVSHIGGMNSVPLVLFLITAVDNIVHNVGHYTALGSTATQLMMRESHRHECTCQLLANAKCRLCHMAEAHRC